MDLTTLIVDLLRKKEEEKALNAGGPVAGPAARPEMLGSGAANKAALEILKRKSAPMEYVDSVQ